MAIRKNRAFAKLATNVDADGDITTTGLASDITADIAAAGTVVYDSAALLPISGNTAGDTAFVKSTSRLYIHSGVGWYNVAVINNTPTVQSITDSDGGTTPFTLATDGTPTTITITAQDSDGDPLTYNYSADSGFAGLATLSQDANVFTITPYSEDSATTESGTITFTVTDGINTATPGAQTFTLTFAQGIADITSTTTTSMTNVTQGTIRAAFVYGNYLWVGREYTLPVFDITNTALNPTLVSDNALDTNVGGPWYDTTTFEGHALDTTNGVLWYARYSYPIRSVTINGNDGTWTTNSGFIPASTNNGVAVAPSHDGSKVFTGYNNINKGSGNVSGIRSYSVTNYSSAPTQIADVDFGTTYPYVNFEKMSVNPDTSKIYVIDEYLYNSSGTNLRPASSSTGTGRLHIIPVNSNGTFGSVVSHQLEASAQAYGTYGVQGTVAYDIDATYDYVYSSPQEVDTLFIMRVSKSNPSSITRYTYSLGTMGDTGFMHYQEGILYIHSDSGLIMLDVKTPGGVPTAHYVSGSVGSNWQSTKNETLKAGKYYAITYTGSNSKVIY